MSSEEKIPIELAGFELVRLYGDDIGRQNNNAEDIRRRVATERIADLAISALTDQQRQTFEELIKVQEELPYAEILGIVERAYQQFEDAALDGYTPVNLTDSERTAYEDARTVAEILPDLTDDAMAVAEEVTRDYVVLKRNDKVQRIEDARANYEQILVASEHALAPLPIPQLINPLELMNRQEFSEDEQASHDEIEAGKIYTFDDVDVALHHAATPREVTESVRRKYPESVLYDASEFLALLLKEVPGTVFSAADLGEILYGFEAPNRDQRVSALVSNYRTGKVAVIGEVLASAGLILQQGSKYVSGINNSQSRIPGMFYRAVPPGADVFVEVGNELTDWQQVNLDEKIEPTDQTEEMPEQRVPVDEASKPELSSSSHPDPVDQTRKEEEPLPRWAADFLAKIREQIKTFYADGLLLTPNDKLSRELVLRKSNSASMGTDTMLEIGVSLKIIKKAEVHDELPVIKFILMGVQNSCKDILCEKVKRERAIELAEQELAEFFELKRDYDGLVRRVERGQSLTDEDNSRLQALSHVYSGE